MSNDPTPTLDMVNLTLSPAQVEQLRDAVVELIGKCKDDLRNARKHENHDLVMTLSEICEDYNELFLLIRKNQIRHNKKLVAKGKTPVFG